MLEGERLSENSPWLKEGRSRVGRLLAGSEFQILLSWSGGGVTVWSVGKRAEGSFSLSGSFAIGQYCQELSRFS